MQDELTPVRQIKAVDHRVKVDGVAGHIDNQDKAHVLRRDLEELDAGLADLERHETRVRGKMLEP